MRRCSAPRTWLWPWDRCPALVSIWIFIPAVTALMGPNGAGKSTLALTLAGLLKAYRRQRCSSPTTSSPAQPGVKRVDWKGTNCWAVSAWRCSGAKHQFAANFVRDEGIHRLRRWGRAKVEGLSDRRPHA